MKVSGQLQALIALPRVQEHPVPPNKRAGVSPRDDVEAVEKRKILKGSDDGK
jgi:hypothetical protein